MDRHLRDTSVLAEETRMMAALHFEEAGLSTPKGKPKALTPLGTPLSQASTEPPSPMFSFGLPEMVRAISNGSTFLPEEEEEVEEHELLLEDAETGTMTPTGTEQDMSGLESELGCWAQAQLIAEDALSFGTPVLESELGRWAQ